MDSTEYDSMNDEPCWWEQGKLIPTQSNAFPTQIMRWKDVERSKSMSILIKGAEKADHCLLCFAFRNGICAVAKKEVVLSKGIPKWCPLVEIPPHGRLIDADKLEYSSISCWAPDEVRPPRDDTEWLISKYEIDEEAPTIIESEEQEHEDK